MTSLLPTTAHELAAMLDAGWDPPAIAVPMRLDDGEQCYAQATVTVDQFFATDGEWLQKGYGFSLAPMVIGLKILTVIGNVWRRRRAVRRAAPRWRRVAQGNVFLTDSRLMVRHEQGWASFWHHDVIETSYDRSGIVVESEGLDPTRFALRDIEYHFVLFYWFAYGQVFHPRDASA